MVFSRGSSYFPPSPHWRRRRERNNQWIEKSYGPIRKNLKVLRKDLDRWSQIRQFLYRVGRQIDLPGVGALQTREIGVDLTRPTPESSKLRRQFFVEPRSEHIRVNNMAAPSLAMADPNFPSAGAAIGMGMGLNYSAGEHSTSRGGNKTPSRSEKSGPRKDRGGRDEAETTKPLGGVRNNKHQKVSAEGRAWAAESSYKWLSQWVGPAPVVSSQQKYGGAGAAQQWAVEQPWSTTGAPVMSTGVSRGVARSRGGSAVLNMEGPSSMGMGGYYGYSNTNVVATPAKWLRARGNKVTRGTSPSRSPNPNPPPPPPDQNLPPDFAPNRPDQNLPPDIPGNRPEYPELRADCPEYRPGVSSYWPPCENYSSVDSNKTSVSWNELIHQQLFTTQLFPQQGDHLLGKQLRGEQGTNYSHSRSGSPVTPPVASSAVPADGGETLLRRRSRSAEPTSSNGVAERGDTTHQNEETIASRSQRVMCSSTGATTMTTASPEKEPTMTTTSPEKEQGAPPRHIWERIEEAQQRAQARQAANAVQNAVRESVAAAGEQLMAPADSCVDEGAAHQRLVPSPWAPAALMPPAALLAAQTPIVPPFGAGFAAN